MTKTTFFYYRKKASGIRSFRKNTSCVWTFGSFVQSKYAVYIQRRDLSDALLEHPGRLSTDIDIIVKRELLLNGTIDAAGKSFHSINRRSR